MRCSTTPATRAAAVSIRSACSENLDPTLALPDPAEVLGSIAIRSDPAAYLRSFQPDQPQFEALRQKLLEARGGGKPAEPAKPDVVIIPDGPVLKFGVQNEQVVLLRKRLDVPADAGANEQLFDKDVSPGRAAIPARARRGARRCGGQRHAAHAQQPARSGATPRGRPGAASRR